ncbi:hypothetical protein AR457_00025 [Streptomyces agglomeratus]|uniref:Uncharacterized protein n=1 Tax=Streptomyces agglomeratus TaxID=285458 RepID=A0A1E5P0T0_9ACTN|nr:hypothetical protein [Streptomyces agglomeratus]OEJ23153.1 hypothetical protein AS594_00015 [Streptomyces agglomeratus]OEJ42752.1 hypothetical protein AR457_00025 [Streptomyces agglomeratus]OEJ55324.1 hypothetical protein BGK72_35790 [Streptomyces agglomeratus]OEJ62676.1 hypothetical protein BGM19_36640 [Streptomyces agglomeratus]
MSEEFTGPPWAADWTKLAAEYRDALPARVRDLINDAVIDLITCRHPYRDDGLDLTQVSIEPVRSTEPRGAHILYFDHGHGWLRYTFVHRTAEPQIIIESLFWQ